MTVWLVELITVPKVYLRLLVPWMITVKMVDPHFKKIKGVVFRRLKGFCFDLILVVGQLHY